MSQFAVLHINKYKGNLNGIGAHIDRLYISKNVNPEKVGFNEHIAPNSSLKLLDILGDTIDASKSHLNTPRPSRSLKEDVMARIKQGYKGKKAIRKDAVLAYGFILTGSHERMMEVEADKKLFEKWKKANYDFIAKYFGEENIVRFTLHLDEKTPHFHAVVVPLTSDGRLSAKDFTGGSDKLTKYQDIYASLMKEFELERGIPKTFTNKVHITGPENDKKISEIAVKTSKETQAISLKNAFDLKRIERTISEGVTQLKVALDEKITENKTLATTNKNLFDKVKVAAYTQGIQERQRQDYEWIKREIDITSFLTQRLGWRIDTVKSTQKETMLIHPTNGERITVPTKPMPQTGHWVFWRVNGEGGGTLIDLLRDENWGWEKIHALSDDKMAWAAIKPATQEEPIFKKPALALTPLEQSEQAQKHLNSIVPFKGDDFLFKRSIDKGMYKDLEGLKVSQQAAGFALYKDFNTQGQARLSSTITYYQKREGGHDKYFQTGLLRGLSVLQEKGQVLQDAHQIVITESPIDALSYRQLSLAQEQGWRTVESSTSDEKPLNPSNTAYISTCGNLTDDIKKDLGHIFKMASKSNQTVVVALDNDKAGKIMSRVLTHLLENAQCNYRIEVPAYGKDWNEVLAQGVYKLDEKHMLSSQELANKQWKLFEAKPYSESILVKAGMLKQTLEAFNENIQTNEKAVMVSLKETNKADITGTWSISIDPVKGMQEHIDLASMPCVAVIKGDVQKAQQIMLVASPLDALIHYNQEMGAIKQMQVANRPEQTALVKERLAKIENTAYVYVEARLKQKVEAPLTKLLKLARAENKELVIASSKGAEKLLQVIEPMLQKQNYKYTKEKIELPAVSQRLATGLGSGVELFGTLASMNRNFQHEDEDEEEEEKNKKSRIRRGF